MPRGAEQMFPDADLLLNRCAFARVGEERTLAPGEILFQDGDYSVPFHVILEGAVDIFHPAEHGGEELITTHLPGQFTGEVDVLSDRRALVRARARTASRVLVLPRARLRGLVQTDSELSELLMRAFILPPGRAPRGRAGGRRRSGLTVAGRAPAPPRREFLTRNGQGLTSTSTSTPRPDTSRRCSTSSTSVRRTFRSSSAAATGCSSTRPTPKWRTASASTWPARRSRVLRDVVVVGGGPAGLAAAVYGASEGSTSW